MWVRSLGQDAPLEREMATHSSILAWGIPWMEETGQPSTTERLSIPVQFSCSVVSDSLRPREPQHARPPCPSPTPGVHSDSRALCGYKQVNTEC